MNANFFRGFFGTIVGAMTLNSPPLYRYPYRSSIEAFRGDWKRIGGDIESAQQRFEGAAAGEDGEDYERS